MTPRNETEEDLENERQVAALLSHAWGADLKKLVEDRLYLADYAAVKNGKITAFIEIRCRSCSSDMYRTIYMPLHKLLWARAMWQATGRPYFFVLRFDGDGVISYTPVHDMTQAPLVWAARATERETHPDGPVVEIDASKLRVIARVRDELDSVDF
jgi:hypothetical protein